MADLITPITANPDTNNPAAFPAQADLAWSQLKTAIPQMNDAIAAFNLNDITDVSTTSTAIGNGAKTFTVSADKSFRPGQVLTFADAASPSSNLMQGIVVSYSGTSLSVTVIQTRGSGTIGNWVISISAMPMLEYDSSILKVTTGNGHGSTNTKIRRLGSVNTNTATNDLTYADSATLGGTVTVVTQGWYLIKYIDEVTGSTSHAGISLNSNQLTTNFGSITNANKLIHASTCASLSSTLQAECVALLGNGDVLRIHTNGTSFTDANTNTSLTIQKISLSGVSTGGGGGGGGGGAPTDAQYIVAVADATLTNERVATTSTSIVANVGTASQISFQRAALTGHVTAPLDSNVTTIPAGTVTNAMQATKLANTVSVNATAGPASPTDLAISTSSLVGRGTGNLQNITLNGSAEMSAAGVLKTKGSFAFNYTVAISAVIGDPGAGFIRFSNMGTLTATDITAVTQIAIDPIMLGGRDISGIHADFDIGGKFLFISNNANSTAWGMFDISDIDLVSTRTILSFTTTTNKGVMPVAGEEILISYMPAAGAGGGLDTQAVLDMKVVRTDASGFLIDELGAVISGAGTALTYTSLVALDEAAYENFVIVNEEYNRSAWVSDTATFKPLQGQYIHEQVNTIVKRVVAVAAVTTWTASNNGGTVRLTASGAVADHGLTSTSNGASIYLTNAPANWTAGSLHSIKTTLGVFSTAILDLDTAWVASMGAPTFAGVNIDIPVATIALPVLRANSRVIFECGVTFPVVIGGATNHITTKLNTTQITDSTLVATTNRFFPFRSGFKNVSSVSAQTAIWGAASTGFAASGLPNTAAVATSAATTWNVFLSMNLVNTPMELPGYTITVQG